MSDTPRLIPMSEGLRQAMLRLCDGDARVPPILHQLWSYRRRDEIYAWLLANRFTGGSLVNLLKFQFKMSSMTMAAFIIAKLEHEKKMRPVLAGKDFITRA